MLTPNLSVDTSTLLLFASSRFVPAVFEGYLGNLPDGECYWDVKLLSDTYYTVVHIIHKILQVFGNGTLGWTDNVNVQLNIDEI